LTYISTGHDLPLCDEKLGGGAHRPGCQEEDDVDAPGGPARHWRLGRCQQECQWREEAEWDDVQEGAR